MNRLHGDDGHQRVIATRELFARGKTIAAELRTAGAKQVVTEGTISSTRLDAVYSLLVGFPPGNYDQRSFGLTIDKKAPTERVQLLIRKYGTHQPPGSRLNRDGHPTAYIRIAGEWNVETALRHVLQEDAEVKTVNLNYIEQ